MTREQLEAMTGAELSEAVAKALGLPMDHEWADGYTCTVRVQTNNYVADYRPVLDAVNKKGLAAIIHDIDHDGRMMVEIIDPSHKTIIGYVSGYAIADNIGRAICIAAVLACGGE
jgi:hypothetical protein